MPGTKMASTSNRCPVASGEGIQRIGEDATESWGITPTRTRNIT